MHVKILQKTFLRGKKADIAVPDPKLLADENSLVIDLALITGDDYAFPLPGAKVISPYAGRRRHHSGVDLKNMCQRYDCCSIRWYCPYG